MADKTTTTVKAPPVIWWLLGIAASCFIVMWGVSGLERTLWWLGLLLGSLALAVGALWFRDALEYDHPSRGLADLITRLFWLMAALILLFGVLVTGKTILGPLFSALSGSDRYSEEYPENLRR